jgi:hypothetical protein
MNFKTASYKLALIVQLDDIRSYSESAAGMTLYEKSYGMTCVEQAATR